MPPLVLCLGEVLWDALPRGLFLGGAPFNVACHLHQQGVSAQFSSRVGDDELGREIRRRMKRIGLDDSSLQCDRELPTGFVVISLDEKGSPTFDVLYPSAWDKLEPTSTLDRLGDEASIAIFGTLAQRDEVARRTIIGQVTKARHRIYDVNLRPPHDSRHIVSASLELATIVKLNDEEFELLSEPMEPRGDMRERANRFLDHHALEGLCVTRGADGAIYTDGKTWCEVGGISVKVADAVGAGDAFLATFVAEHLVDGKDAATALKIANAVGAHVASQDGATPSYDKGEIFRKLIS